MDQEGKKKKKKKSQVFQFRNNNSNNSTGTRRRSNDAHQRRRSNRMRSPVGSPAMGGNAKSLHEDDAVDWFMFERRLNSRSSRLRHNDAYFLLYTILDTIVHEYEPIVGALQRRLDRYEHHLLHANPDLYISKSVARLKRQLEMFHRLVRFIFSFFHTRSFSLVNM